MGQKQRHGTRSGVIVALDDRVATIVIGEAREEWYFPASLLPGTVGVDDRVVLEGSGHTLRVGHGQRLSLAS